MFTQWQVVIFTSQRMSFVIRTKRSWQLSHKLLLQKKIGGLKLNDELLKQYQVNVERLVNLLDDLQDEAITKGDFRILNQCNQRVEMMCDAVERFVREARSLSHQKVH